MSLIGCRVGGFEILARIGAGGQGEVFLARPWERDPARRQRTRLWLRRRHAALKLDHSTARHWGLAALKLAHATSADSLHDEHRHLAGLAAPHLPRLYSQRFPLEGMDFGLHSAGAGQAPRAYMALAYEPGASLDRMLAARHGPFPAAWSAAVGLQLAGALEHLHSRGVIHHDVRPANVIIGTAQPPSCVLVDLGAAETPGAPRRRAIYGAAGYLPPERTGATPAMASAQVDIFGLGMVLRALTAGAPPPEPLAELIAEATDADPGRRRAALPDMAALRLRLERLATGLKPAPHQAWASTGVRRWALWGLHR
jgi:serine/threonine protein kinase